MQLYMCHAYMSRRVAADHHGSKCDCSALHQQRWEMDRLRAVVSVATGRLPAAVLAAGFVALTAPVTSYAATCAQSAIVERAGNAMIQAAKSASPAAFSGALRSYADMGTIAMFALGKYRQNLPAGKRDEFVALTTDYVSRTLNDFRLKFRAES